MRQAVRVTDATTEEKRRGRAEPKGPTFTVIWRLPAGVSVEQAKQTVARAIADLVGGAR
jgi:hypothetical protein